MSNIGSASLLMTFIVLCLVTFAVLSLSGAVSEYNYTQQLAQHNTEYLEASNAATQLLSEIDGQLREAHRMQSFATADETAYYGAADDLLGEISDVTTDFSSDTPTAAFVVPVNDSQALSVVLELNPPRDFADGYYKVKTWQEVSTAEWHGDDSLNLIQ